MRAGGEALRAGGEARLVAELGSSHGFGDPAVYQLAIVGYPFCC